MSTNKPAAAAAATPKKPDMKKKSGTASAAEESAAPFPKMDLGQRIHSLTALKSHHDVMSDDVELQAEVFEQIAVELHNPSLYQKLQELMYDGLTPMISAAKLTKQELIDLEKANAVTEKEIDDKIKLAMESAGDMELMDARIEMARFAAKSLTQAQAVGAYQAVLDLPKISSGKKIDVLMESARIASFYGDTLAADNFIDRADKLATEGGGGDWDRRNRLKVYKALQRMLHRDIETASTLLLDCIATFSCNEVCSYTDFIVYTILTNMLHLPRPELKTKIIDGPEVLSVAGEIPIVLKLVKSFYDCDYKTYLNAMVEVETLLLKDRYFFPHASFWMREMHILAYKQFLDSYQSVTLSAMAEAFGVSTAFIDYHASRFIAANRLSAKIDKYGGVIVTNRPDLKNAQYREMIQKGDLLLNRIQKLARVVDL